MNIVSKLLFLALLSGSLACGCSSSDQPQAARAQAVTPTTVQEMYTIGKTAKEQVLAEWGKPNGVAINEKGEEVLTFNKSHVTGKQFIPFYFGRDSFRVKLYNFTFNKEGILTGVSASEQHY